MDYRFNTATVQDIVGHLLLCDAYFSPPLSQRIDLNEYAGKIVDKAERFEAWSQDALIGLVAIYCNDPQREVTFISNVSVMPGWHGKGIGTRLLGQSIEYARQQGFARILLEVASASAAAISLYEKNDFLAIERSESLITMCLYLKNRESYEHRTQL